MVLLVTGASRGIGAATARLAASRGYTVALNYRSNRDAADAVVRDIERVGGRAAALQADVSREADVCRLFEEIDRGLGALTALVNNAAILETQMRLDTMTADRLTRVFATNVTGAFLCAREAVRRMSTARGGHGGAIVNVSSGAARLGSPGEYIDYAASKGAIDTMTIGLARGCRRRDSRERGAARLHLYRHARQRRRTRPRRSREGIRADEAWR
jgi:NAD(P)-dependent dehydrogenase (short-subunit alcohol dehydrogenase family)